MGIDGVESDLKQLNIRKAKLITKRNEQTVSLKGLDDQLTSSPEAGAAQIAEIQHATGLLLSALRTSEREIEALNQMERHLNAEHTFWQKQRRPL